MKRPASLRLDQRKRSLLPRAYPIRRRFGRLPVIQPIQWVTFKIKAVEPRLSLVNDRYEGGSRSDVLLTSEVLQDVVGVLLPELISSVIIDC